MTIQKINPNTPPGDPCQTSFDWLVNYASKWFKENVADHGLLWFADESSYLLPNKYPAPDQKVEIILTGSFHVKIFESKHWNFNQVRFWTFSSKVLQYFVEVVGLPASSIGLIERPRMNTQFLSIDFSKEVNLVYAGRLSYGKNIPALLMLVSSLQSKGLNVTLDLFGEFDDFPNESVGRIAKPSTKSIIEQTLNELTWTIPPIFHGQVAQNIWPEVNRKKPVFISLSTSLYEDFGTATQIALDTGWPVIVSDWGGHHDASPALRIPTNLIAQSHDPQFSQEAMTRILAQKLTNAELQITASQLFNFSKPKYFDFSELNDILEEFRQQFFPEYLLCLRDKMDAFADTASGILFFRELNHIFGSASYSSIVVYNDLKHYSFKDILDLNSEYSLLPIRFLFSPFSLRILSQLKRIYYFKGELDLDKTKSFLGNDIEFIKLNGDQ